MESLVRAPELESPLGWLNTGKALRIAHELRGQVVLLDFWTYCCINCLHILPDLKFLEDKYRGDPLVVIGVHSAKFTNEASRQTIRSAIHRYEIEHPVIVDDRMQLWRAYAGCHAHACVGMFSRPCPRVVREAKSSVLATSWFLPLNHSETPSESMATQAWTMPPSRL